MHHESAGQESFRSEENAMSPHAADGSDKRPRGRRRRWESRGAASGLDEMRGKGLRRPKFKRVSRRTHEVTLTLTPRQAVVWLMNLDSISDLYEMTTGEFLRPESRAQLRAVLRALARENSGATRC